MQAVRSKKLRVFALCFLALFVVPPTFHNVIGSQASTSYPVSNMINLKDNLDTEPMVQESIFLNDDKQWALSDIEPSSSITEGIIDPVPVEQSGYSSTGNISARTDTMVNTAQSLDIDVAHDWYVSSAEVDITNLEKLYVINGSFDEGDLGYTVSPNGTLIYAPNGWSAVSNNTDTTLEQRQLVSYEESGERYVSVQNQGKPQSATNPQHQYTHFEGTCVLWNQSFDVVPYTEDFYLRFSYLYLQGPLSPIFSGDFYLQVLIDNVAVWNIDLPTLSSRGTWFETGTIPINIAIPSGTTMFMIGLVINSTFITDADDDYDLDGSPDGILNTQYITAFLDDVSLISATPPSCEAVDLQFILDGITTPIMGTLGIGFGFQENPLHWQVSPLSFSIISNTSISLDYNAKFLHHRFLNSTPTTNSMDDGVAYTITPNQSGTLELFTYLGFSGVYENLTIKVYHPVDWQNFTVFDPFLVDTTSSCTEEAGFIEIPTSLLVDRLGWWKVTCNSYNYAFNASIQRYDSEVTDWVEEGIFHSNDEARLSVDVSSLTQTPILSDAVNFSWFLPNGTSWHQSSTVSGLIGSADSSSVSFGPINTTAGIWSVMYLWTNNTEIAFGSVEFALHHQATLEVVFESALETVVGQPVTVVMRFFDIENGLLLLNDGAAITSMWAGGTVDFEVNLVKNWWQADFDTTLVGAGNFEVIINSSAPFFETTPVIITIKSEYLTELDSPAGPLEPLIYGRSYSYDFFYSQSLDGLGIEGATVEISGEGSEWASVVDIGNGNYNLTLIPLGERDYNIRILFSKIGYENQSFVLSFLVEKVPIRVQLISPLSAREYQPIEVEVAVLEVGTDIPVLNANVTLSVKSSAGPILILQTMDEEDNGHYTASLSMPPANTIITYGLIIQVSKDNYELVQDFQYTLVPLVDVDAQLFQAIIQYSQQIAIGASVLVAAVIGQRAYSRKNKRKHAAAREIKIRFNDANNLLGVIVLHKLSGIPIYSKILKGGFEEGMLSAFITAIMHFRSEFDTIEESGEYRILPISDIIRAIPTSNLICAFFTLSSASKEQEAKMIGFARAVGMMLDEALGERPTKVIDAKTVKTFEWFFDDFADGTLLRKYQLGEKELSGNFKRLKKTLPEVKTDGTFNLDKMVLALEESGLSEDDAYLLTIDAIEKEIILPIYSFNDIIDDETEHN
ncbi:hypothetical protein EU528_14090 [Candidatus Thorarchaeota archaeon]|nr:MAG: hypothetical protein EU528_14090 [Candidatus Thorarchaeota archaeon]